MTEWNTMFVFCQVKFLNKFFFWSPIEEISPTWTCHFNDRIEKIKKLMTFIDRF